MNFFQDSNWNCLTLVFGIFMVPVYEMLQCAKECANRSTAAYLTFGEFCVFATELKRCYEKGYLNQTDLLTEYSHNTCVAIS